MRDVTDTVASRFFMTRMCKPRSSIAARCLFLDEPKKNPAEAGFNVSAP
jgi:hypothetical protein